MHLSDLSFINFKNYREANFEFLPGVNCFTGHNGAGKTNILDAIHYLCLCKSFFNPVDSQSIFHEEPFFVIQGNFEVEQELQNVYCGFKKNHKKQFKRNQKEYQRLADHIGIYPLVMISPSDHQLILDGSEERRRFIDAAISQVDNHYLDDLIYYNKVLLNRNALLKKMNENPQYDEGVLVVFNEQLAEYAEKIYAKRRQFIDEFIPLFNELYQSISSGMEEVSISYESQLNDHSILELLNKNSRKDIITQRSNYGTHKDDLEFKLGEHPLKKFGSQGQQKSYLIALKLAHYSYLQLKKGYKPLLLLDDIFDKLDDQRIKKLLAMVSNDAFGQIFITDTDANRVENIFQEIGVDVRIFEIEKGSIIQSR
jgi:DNA replication and repair protein RecF